MTGRRRSHPVRRAGVRPRTRNGPVRSGPAGRAPVIGRPKAAHGRAFSNRADTSNGDRVTGRRRRVRQQCGASRRYVVILTRARPVRSRAVGDEKLLTTRVACSLITGSVDKRAVVYIGFLFRVFFFLNDEGRARPPYFVPRTLGTAARIFYRGITTAPRRTTTVLLTPGRVNDFFPRRPRVSRIFPLVVVVVYYSVAQSPIIYTAV